MVPLQTFLKISSDTGNRSWLVLPRSLLSWGLKHFESGGRTPTQGPLPEGQYVLTANLKVEGNPRSGIRYSGGWRLTNGIQEAARQVIRQMAYHSGRVERLLPMNLFRNEATTALGLPHEITSDDMKILLVHLARDMKMIAYNEQVRF